jgi:ATP-dependent helicase/nuclease subunit B
VKHKFSSDVNFLESVAEIAKKNADVTIILPNKRSCRELKKYWREGEGFPKTVAVSDLFSFENEKSILSLVTLLKQKIPDVPFNKVYELAAGLCSLLNELVLNKVDPNQLSEMIPDHLQKYWNHTIGIIETAVNIPEIKENLKHIQKRSDNFLRTGGRIMTAGIKEVNYYAKQLLKKATEDGIVVSAAPLCEKNIVDFQEFNSIFDEGAGIAIAVEAAVSEKKSVLIISPNRDLADIIKPELQHRNIFADDSRGVFFSKTASGILISLIIDMAENFFDCASVINVLKISPTFRAIALEIELFFRGLRSVPSDFFTAFDLYPKDKVNAEFLSLIDKFHESFKNFADLKPFSDRFDMCCLLASEINPESAEQLRELFPCSDWSLKITLQEFGVFIRKYVLSQPVRTAEGYTPGVVILGAIEAQLLDADCIIIADANDESWCKSAEKNDFWMTQSMMNHFGMQSVEMKNEFLQSIFERFAGKKDVLITRSILVGGVRQQRYRYFNKLTENIEIREAAWLKKIMEDTKKRRREPIKFEKPCPEISLRPRNFTVSDVDLLRENPYAFYAKKILKLPELNHINELKNIRGNYMHNVLEHFVKNNKFTSDDFLRAAQKILKNSRINSVDLGLWFFRLNKISNFIVSNMNATEYLTEVRGSISIPVGEDCCITLRCRADRIDLDENGNITIIDYKTGAVPSIISVKEGKKMQLPLEAIIAENGGFGPGKTKVREFCYWKPDGKDEGGKIISVANDEEEIRKINDRTLEQLKALVLKYNILGEGYDLNIDSPYEKPYMHLARAKEIE